MVNDILPIDIPFRIGIIMVNTIGNLFNMAGICVVVSRIAQQNTFLDAALAERRLDLRRDVQKIHPGRNVERQVFRVRFHAVSECGLPRRVGPIFAVRIRTEREAEARCLCDVGAATFAAR